MLERLGRLQKSVVFSWLISYLSILLIPLLLSGFVYSQSVRIIQSQVSGINEAMIRQLQQSVDVQAQNLEKISLQIAMNPKMVQFIAGQGMGTPAVDFAYAEKVKQLLQDFSIYTLSSSMIKDFYIYLHQSEIVLTSSGYLEGRYFFDTRLLSEDRTYAGWRDDMLRKAYLEYEVVTSRLDNGETDTGLTLRRSLPLQGENRSATLVIFLNKAELQKLVAGVNWANQDMFFIIDKNNRPLFSTKALKLPSFISYEQMKGPGGVLYGELEGKQVAVSYLRSAASEWCYISITETALFNERVEYIRKLTLASLVLCVLLGGVIAFWFTKKNYNPLSALIRRVSSQASLGLAKDQNEYLFLDEAFATALSEKQRSDKKLEQQYAALRASFLARLLKGRPGYGVHTDDALYAYGIDLEAPYVAVLIFYIDDYSQLMVHGSEGENLRLAQFIIHNVTEELLSGHGRRGYVAEVDDLMVCLLNMDGEDGSSPYREAAAGAREIQELLSRKFQIFTTAAISRLHRTMAGIPEAYNEALEAMEYKLIKGKGGIIGFEEIKPAKEAPIALGAYSYSLETEQMLTNSIKTGDYGQTESIMNQIFAANFSEGHLSVQMARCLMFELAGTMIKTMYELSAQVEPELLERIDPAGNLLQCNTIEDMRERMFAMVRSVCGFISERNKGAGQAKLREKVTAFIHRHYADGSLNLDRIAEHTHLSSKYVSAFFKQATGEGISGYINKVRLKEAKALLLAGDQSIGDIARQVGFTNSQALIRAFHRHEGVTPGQFREINQPSGKEVTTRAEE